MEIIYSDKSIIVCVKPFGVVSTDEPGGVPSLVREALGDESAHPRTVHRLDQVVGGAMVLAATQEAAAELSRQIRQDGFAKEYLAVCHWRPKEDSGKMTDLLKRDPKERKTHVVHEMDRDTRPAELAYEVVASRGGMSLVRIDLITGRTHQIRAQFSSRGLPLVGDKKYSRYSDDCEIALWSYRLRFTHTQTGKLCDFTVQPPKSFPWTLFADTMILG